MPYTAAQLPWLTSTTYRIQHRWQIYLKSINDQNYLLVTANMRCKINHIHHVHNKCIQCTQQMYTMYTMHTMYTMYTLLTEKTTEMTTDWKDHWLKRRLKKLLKRSHFYEKIRKMSQITYHRRIKDVRFQKTEVI